MATIGNTYLSLADVFKQSDGDGKITADLIELLAAQNPLLKDMTVVECNDGTRHLTTVRTGLPPVTWRKLYQGVVPGKSTSAQVTDTTGMLEAWSQVDKKLLDISGDPKQVRMNEAAAFLEAMNQEMATRIFYGDNVANPEQFLGLAPRFNSLSAPNGQQIVNATGSSNANQSVWVVAWSPRTVMGLYPKGSRAGLQRQDIGEETVTDTNGASYRAMRERFMWDMGLSVKDWRYVVRIANIDSAALIAGTVDVFKWLRKATYKMQSRRVAQGQLAIYCSRDFLEALDADSTPTKSVATTTNTRNVLTPKEMQGEEVMTYRGIPIRETDALVANEANVT